MSLRESSRAALLWSAPQTRLWCRSVRTQTVDTDRGHRPWTQTVDIDRGHMWQSEKVLPLPERRRFSLWIHELWDSDRWRINAADVSQRNRSTAHAPQDLNTETSAVL
uniref:Uncharacterized protein n=1 Tax=Knipowitschia caucasica TaxID=637954 RepID=A0AAV2K7H3_KNICA